MAHEIFGERFWAREKPGWHELGHVFTGEVSPIEAVEQSGMDFRVFTAPLLVDLGGIQVPYNQVAIVREPTPDDYQYRVFGSASENYTLIQNREIAELVTPLADKWPLETVGALQDGMTMFLTLYAGQEEIKGDPIKMYFLIDDTRDGGSAMSITFTPVRVVCWNTLSAGRAAAIASRNLRHTTNIRDEAEWHVQLIGQMQKVQDKVVGAFEIMANATLLEQQIDKVIAKSYPYPRKPRKVQMRDELDPDELQRVDGLLESVRQAERNYETLKAKMDERREVVRQLLGTFNDEQPNLANTGWAVYNSVVEFEDYRKEHGNEDALVSALFGGRARTKEYAYAAVLDAAQEAPF